MKINLFLLIFTILITFFTSCSMLSYEDNVSVKYLNAIEDPFNGTILLRYNAKNNTNIYLKMSIEVNVITDKGNILLKQDTDLLPNFEMIKGIKTNILNNINIISVDIKINEINKMHNEIFL